MKWNEDGSVTLEMRLCWSCNGTKEISGHRPCSICKGTGRTKGGTGKGSCRKCFNGQVVDHNIRVPCRSCGGSGEQMETTTDYMPREWMERFQYRVFRSNRPQTLNEYLLAIGCLYSCTDYGSYKQLTDEQLIAKVKNDTHTHQLCKVYDEKGQRMASYIGIFCNDNGYTPKAIFE